MQQTLDTASQLLETLEEPQTYFLAMIDGLSSVSSATWELDPRFVNSPNSRIFTDFERALITYKMER